MKRNTRYLSQDAAFLWRCVTTANQTWVSLDFTSLMSQRPDGTNVLLPVAELDMAIKITTAVCGYTQLWDKTLYTCRLCYEHRYDMLFHRVWDLHNWYSAAIMKRKWQVPALLWMGRVYAPHSWEWCDWRQEDPVEYPGVHCFLSEHSFREPYRTSQANRTFSSTMKNFFKNPNNLISKHIKGSLQFIIDF